MTRNSIAGAALIAALTVPTVSRAHDGHGEKLVMSGTIKTVASERIEIESFDQSTMQLKRIWVITSTKTTYKRGRVRVDRETAEPRAGERATMIVSSEHTEDNSVRLLAIQIELPAAKK